jgi:hypothetical protein
MPSWPCIRAASCCFIPQCIRTCPAHRSLFLTPPIVLSSGVVGVPCSPRDVQGDLLQEVAYIPLHSSTSKTAIPASISLPFMLCLLQLFQECHAAQGVPGHSLHVLPQVLRPVCPALSATGASGVPCSPGYVPGRAAAGGSLHPAHSAHQQPSSSTHTAGSHGRTQALWGWRCGRVQAGTAAGGSGTRDARHGAEGPR